MASHSGRIKVLHVGLGPVGAAVVRLVAGRKGFTIVGAVDADPANTGRDLGEVSGVGRALKLKVLADTRKAIKAARPDVVVLCTVPSLKKAAPQIIEILDLKVPIVSTTEELVYPSKANMKYAGVIHAAAKKARVAVLGAGVNPGFVMDALPIAITAVCDRVDAIRVDHIEDACTRGVPFLQQIGAGLTREQFQKKVDEGSVRHVGLTESISMIADAMHWKLDRIVDDVQPKIAGDTVTSEFLAVDAGFVCGIIQDGVGYRNGAPVVVLHVEAYLGAPKASDSVEITGSPALKMTFTGGVAGEIATASVVANSLRRILDVAPGLHTMRDMPLPSFDNGR